LGKAFKHVKGKKFYPCIEVCHANCDLIVNFKPKKYPKKIRSEMEEQEEDEEEENNSE
jgi:allophanate hydrolase subunit 1